MKIKDITPEWVEEELELVKHKPLCYNTVSWYAELLTLRHRMQKMETKHDVFVKTEQKNGYGKHDGKPDRKWAEKIVSRFLSSDGKHGGKWSFEQTEGVRTSKGLHCDPAAFYIVMNSLYSDYDAVFKKHNVSTADFYADVAEAWLMDEDAVEDKVERYFEEIAK